MLIILEGEAKQGKTIEKYRIQPPHLSAKEEITLHLYDTSGTFWMCSFH